MCCFRPAAKVWSSTGTGGVSAGGSSSFLLCQLLFPVLGSRMRVFYLLVTSKQHTVVKWFNCKEFWQIPVCSWSSNLSNTVLQLHRRQSGFCCKYLWRKGSYIFTLSRQTSSTASLLKENVFNFLFVCIKNLHGSMSVFLGTFLKMAASCWWWPCCGILVWCMFWKLAGQSMFWQ